MVVGKRMFCAIQVVHSLTAKCFSIGQSGLGKSTLVNSLFMADVFEDSAYEGSAYRVAKTTQVV